MPVRIPKSEVRRDIEAFRLKELDPPPVQTWAVRAMWHRAEHRPRMYRQLKQQGRLRQAVVSAAEKTVDVLSELIEKGMDPCQAEELVREMWVLLPTEEDVPTLGEGRDPLSYAHGIYSSGES